MFSNGITLFLIIDFSGTIEGPIYGENEKRTTSLFDFFKNILPPQKQPAPSVSTSNLDNKETNLRRQRLYETANRSDSSHEVQSSIFFNLSSDNLNKFQGAFVGTVFRPQTNNGKLLYPHKEKFIYLIELNSDEKLGPVFYESKIFNSIEEAEADRWVLKSKISNKSVQEVKDEEEKEEANTNLYYYFNLSKRLYDSGVYESEELKNHLAIALTKNISPLSKAWVFKTLGTIYLNLEDFDKAKASFEEALRLNPKVGVKNLLKKLNG